MQTEKLLYLVSTLKRELEGAINSAVIQLPENFLEAIRLDKGTPELLQSIVHCATAAVGLNIVETLADHYETGHEYWFNINLWSDEMRNNVKLELLNKVQSVKPTKAVFNNLFAEYENLTIEEPAKVLSIYKEIANCAINYVFDIYGSEMPHLQAQAYQHILLLADILPPCPIILHYRISLSRLECIVSNEGEPIKSQSLQALKEIGRTWYQNSNHEFLNHKETYNSLNMVEYYLYLLNEKELEHLRNEYLTYAENHYRELLCEPRNSETLMYVEHLVGDLETILSWKVES